MMERMLRATASVEARHFWFRGLRAFVTPLVRQALDGRPAPRILDAGCGTGANLEWLGAFGRAYGFDLSEVALQFAHALGRTRVARASIAAAPFPANTFDLVTSFDVLYALPDPVEAAAVAELARVARPGGYVLVNVAAMEVLRGDHSMLCHEVRRYSRERLRAAVAGAGLEIVRLTYTNRVLFPPLLAARTLQRWRGLVAVGDAAPDLTLPPAAVNALLSALLRLEAWTIRRRDARWFGSSVLCLARKPNS